MNNPAPQSFSTSPLTVTAFLPRAAAVFADRLAVVDGDTRLTYREFADRTGRLVSALHGWGIAPGDRVAALCSNSHVMLELHHAIPAMGAVLVPVNTRLAAAEVAYILDHSGAHVLVVTGEYRELALAATAAKPDIRVIVADGPGSEYESTLSTTGFTEIGPIEADDALLAINYTSGTTGRPKGVMYNHRGAYLQAIAMAYHAGLTPDSGYLWTLPMFHCNGWCFPWAVTASGGTHICLRAIDTTQIWHHLAAGSVTHLCCAPTVLTMVAEDDLARILKAPVTVLTGGAPPSPALLRRVDGLGFRTTHLYGMTETYGPIVVNWWQSRWDQLTPDERSRLRARQGIGNIVSEQPRVLHPDGGSEVTPDGTDVGELVVRGNNVMAGYYRDPAATAAATVSSWLRTGDLAVVHPDGYLELRDRAKDIIISGGENIASVEVERAIDEHPDVIESAVVARSDEKWGEVPVAFVTARRADLSEREIIEHCRARLARFKAPKAVFFTELPKTSTGKIRKNLLRES
ncbi:putative fatty-acid--CoA ligase [Gordonia effusa NBRC 100432]|uniref:Putative fatty-acid--CoA ligase n=1 Tax=Gordonia effusa NBRC 100432 TaxID=1077974 RepID=H0QWI0_9ACTN|nr:AMP-binding protein [Gordonia effusa]GAB17181.1 putative fatty-acid--CoA ligase [Gordonia effusa NBRC 100432]